MNSRTRTLAMMSMLACGLELGATTDPSLERPVGRALPPTSRRPARKGDAVNDWKRRRREQALAKLEARSDDG